MTGDERGVSDAERITRLELALAAVARMVSKEAAAAVDDWVYCVCRRCGGIVESDEMVAHRISHSEARLTRV